MTKQEIKDTYMVAVELQQPIDINSTFLSRLVHIVRYEISEDSKRLEFIYKINYFDQKGDNESHKFIDVAKPWTITNQLLLTDRDLSTFKPLLDEDNNPIKKPAYDLVSKWIKIGVPVTVLLSNYILENEAGGMFDITIEK